jgi:acyl-CoA-binding protein
MTIEGEELHRELFNNVIAAVNSSTLPPAPVSNDRKLRLYGLFKRITVGKLHDSKDGNSSEPRPSKPSMFNLVAYHKYEAWGKCDVLSIPDAIMEYVRLIASEDNEVGRSCGEMLKVFEGKLSK